VSIHADDEFSLRIALEGELDDVVPADGLAGMVIARYRRTRRRRVAGAVGLVVVAAGIGVPLGVTSSSGGHSSKPANPSQGGGAPDRVGSAQRQHAGAAQLIGRQASHLALAASSLSPATLASLTSANSFAVAA
jgi:hypothetical protein